MLLGQADDADIILQDLGLLLIKHCCTVLEGFLSIRVLASGISLKKDQTWRNLAFNRIGNGRASAIQPLLSIHQGGETDADLTEPTAGDYPYERTRYS